jgi:hypothetical protein
VGVLPDPSGGKNYEINYWIDDNGYMGTLKCDIGAYGIKWEELKELLDTIHVEQISI